MQQKVGPLFAVSAIAEYKALFSLSLPDQKWPEIGILRDPTKRAKLLERLFVLRKSLNSAYDLFEKAEHKSCPHWLVQLLRLLELHLPPRGLNFCRRTHDAAVTAYFGMNDIGDFRPDQVEPVEQVGSPAAPGP